MTTTVTTTVTAGSAESQDPFDGEYEPSPVPRIRDQVALCEATEGVEGNIAHPDVLVQDGSDVLHLRAREVFGTEKQHWWPVAERFWRSYPEYRQRAAGREIPLILLEPIVD